MKREKKIIVVFSLILFLAVYHNILAQEKEFYINPTENTAGAEIYREVDLSLYKYQWEVISNQNDIIIPRTAVSSAQIWERFITSRGDVGLVTSNHDMITIRWNGRKPNGDIPDDGKYFINVYETAINDTRIEKLYFYPVSIITEGIYFRIVLESDSIDRTKGQWLVCTVETEDTEKLNEYVWKSEISKDGVLLSDKPFRIGQESPFPRFMWNKYEDLKEEIVSCVITVKATDRAGTEFICQDPLPFIITDTELINQLTQSRREDERLLSDGDQESFQINEGTDYSWLLSSGYEIYTVRSHDYLAKIAREYYGTSYLWGLIYELNKDKFPMLGVADLILPGMKLRLPPKSVLENLRNNVEQ